ncbi:MAG: signal recognition particle protein [Rickettsiales bacterium]
MFERLSDGFSGIFSRLTAKGALTEKDVDAAMREIRVALLEADVSLPVAKRFIADVRDKAVGEKLFKSVSPGQMVAKLVHDALKEALGGDATDIDVKCAPPAVILMAGVQGSGKTTSSGKLALWLKKRLNKRALLASLDVYRPAAQTQLQLLADRVSCDALPIVEGQRPEAIAERALHAAKKGGYDVLIVDTAGRLHVDDAMMEELKNVKNILLPQETLLVVDAMTGQDAVNVAERFNAQDVGVTGVVLTRLDGDARGGAALSMRYATGVPIKFAGTGERPEDFSAFRPDGAASSILGMGDVVGLVEKVAENVREQDAKDMEKAFLSGRFTLDDMLRQFAMMRKMGGLGGLMKFIPGMGKLQENLPNPKEQESKIKRMEAIIFSMTKAERKNPDLLNGSRKRRIAKGSGVDVADVNRLLKAHKDMSTMMKKISRTPKKKLMRQFAGGAPSSKPR